MVGPSSNSSWLWSLDRKPHLLHEASSKPSLISAQTGTAELLTTLDQGLAPRAKQAA